MARDPVEALARLGATMILSRYIEAEVSAHLGAERYERTDARTGSRNGHRRRKVSCSVGTLDIDFPKVRDAEMPFRSQVLTRWQRSSRAVISTLPRLYSEGLSTRDFERALRPMWEGTSLSRSTVSRANEQIKEGFRKWRRRSLALEEIAYLFLDGHYEGVRLGTKGKEAVLAIHGITKTGARTLLGLYLGCRESTERTRSLWTPMPRPWKLCAGSWGWPQTIPCGWPAALTTAKTTWSWRCLPACATSLPGCDW